MIYLNLVAKAWCLKFWLASANLTFGKYGHSLNDLAFQQLPLFEFMLEAFCEGTQGVLLDQVFFNLDTDQFQQFTALLDAPPASNPGLERLMAVKPPWSTMA